MPSHSAERVYKNATIGDGLALVNSLAPATVEKPGTIRPAIPWQPDDTIAVPNLHKERPFHSVTLPLGASGAHAR